MARILAPAYIIHLLFVQLIFLISINGDNSTFYNNITIDNDVKSDRSKRSPTNNAPEQIEAMIMNENNKFIYLQWKKARQTLANINLPIWTAHLNKWGTFHHIHPELSFKIDDLVAYHDLEQSSAVLYDKSEETLSGSIGSKYYVNGLPINLLHQCHKVGGPYIAISPHDSHRATDHLEPSINVIRRFQNCGHLLPLSNNLPSSSNTPRQLEDSECTINRRNVNKREINSKFYSTSEIRKRRETPEHFYLEILLFVPHNVVIYHKTALPGNYLMGVLTFHLMYFNAIDMLYAKLKTHDLHIHINLAGIIIEDDQGAFDSVIDYSRYAKGPHVGELYHTRVLRYLEYCDLPFEKDSIDLIFSTTDTLIQSEDFTDSVFGLTWSIGDKYRGRQMYKRIDNTPLSVVTFTYNLYEFCVGAHEIGHTLKISHDPQNIEMIKGRQCYGLMQERGPHCYNCMNWSPESINELQLFTRFDKNRCFLLNYPRSLNPPEPRVTSSPCRQCQCYGYEFYGELGQCLLQVPAGDCGKRLQCKSSYYDPDLLHLMILPLDGTPCGDNKVCWEKHCVDI